MVVLRNGKITTAPIKTAKSQRTDVCDGGCYKTKELVIDGTTWLNVKHYVRASWYYLPDSPQHMEYYNIIKSADGPNKVKMLVYQEKGGKYTKDWVINKETDKRNINEVVELYKHLEVREDWKYICNKFWEKADEAQFQILCKICQDNIKRNRHDWQKINSDINPIYVYTSSAI